MADTTTTATPKPIGNKNEKVGQVVSNKMAKTIVVEVTRRVQHPLYKRIVQKRKKFYAHDEKQEAQPGDVVRIIECRPLSKLKRWQLGEIIRKAVQVNIDLPSDLSTANAKASAAAKKKKKKQ
jgi:small subunit ribosomal protein S17